MRDRTKEHEVSINKLLDDGAGFGIYDQREWHVLNSLPGETVQATLIKRRGGMRYGMAQHVSNPSNHRISPLEPDHFTSCSPWQIITAEHEDEMKLSFAQSLFPWLPSPLKEDLSIYSDHTQRTGYRNKMEYSFYTDKETNLLSLCFFQRMGTAKIPIDSCALASPAITYLSQQVLIFLRALTTNSFHYKSLMIRATRDGAAQAMLFVKDLETARFIFNEIPQHLSPVLHIIYSDHRSPASVVTEKIGSDEIPILTETVCNSPLSYSPLGFFQVNLPIFETALQDMRQYLHGESVTDLYCGVGTISIALAESIHDAVLVEADFKTGETIKKNITQNNLSDTYSSNIALAESSLDAISSKKTLIIDPPRAGLHHNVIRQILATLPPRIIYLSCNPATQSRDCAQLLEKYTPIKAALYNFFPMTPHTESLVILDRKAR